MAQLAVSLLGPPHATYDGRPVAGVESNKVWALLAYLVLEADRPHQREALIGLLWPEQPEAAARHNLRQALANLRQTLHDDAAAPPFLLITRTTIQFNGAADCHLDVAAFSARLAACEQHAHQQPETCAPCMRWRRQAVALYRGDFLDRFFVRDSVAFEEWALIKREGLHQRMLDALARLVAYYEQRSRHGDATAAARRLLELDPLREETHRDLMRLLATAGQRSAALAQYTRCRRLLQNEFGIEPEAETTVLYQRIRIAAPDALVAAGRPEQATSHLTNLPTPSTPLIGRDWEITALSAHLNDDNTRLLTLMGSPGIGKTRLSLAVAAALQKDFDDGVFFVGLAHIRDNDLVAPTIAQALGVKEIGDQSLIELLKSFLHDKQLLLLLDNFEQLLDAAPLIAELLVDCPYLKAIVTSRAALRVRAERQFLVAPLALPDSTALTDVESVARAPAVALFVERAQAIMPGFALRSENVETVAAICRLLDGLPLAIELAAARSLALPPEALLAQLDRRLAVLADGPRDLPERQQTLRAAIGWSYYLLDTSAQALFRRLGVFVGGWTLEAVEWVANAPGALDRSTSDGLALLLNQSLLRHQVEIDGQWRFTMLETLREYAQEQLEANGEAEISRQRHAGYFLELAETADVKLRGEGQQNWLARLEREHGNLRATLAWALRGGDVELGCRLAIALEAFWNAHAYWHEAWRWREAALAQSGGVTPAIRAMLLLRAADNTWQHESDWELARTRAHEALILFRAMGDRSGIAAALTVQGRIADDNAQATQRYEASLALYRELGDRHGIATTLHRLGNIARDQGDIVRAVALLEESLVLYREQGFVVEAAGVLNGLGDVACRQGDHLSALALYWEAVLAIQPLGDYASIMWPLRNLGWMALIQGDDGRVRALLQEYVDWSRDKAALANLSWLIHILGAVVSARGDAAQASALVREGLILKQRFRFWTDESLQAFAGVAAGQGQPVRAARLLGAIATASRQSAPQAAYDHLVTTVRGQLDEAAFAAAWAAGQVLKPEQAIAEALE